MLAWIVGIGLFLLGIGALRYGMAVVSKDEKLLPYFARTWAAGATIILSAIAVDILLRSGIIR